MTIDNIKYTSPTKGGSTTNASYVEGSTTVGEGVTFMFVDATVGWTILGTFGASVQPLITQ